MPSHNHSGSTNWVGEHNHRVIGYYSAGGSGQRGVQNIISNNSNTADVGYTSNSGGHSHTVSIGNTGSNSTHNNMQPYLSVYIWKRTV